jgi:hypothetical protein
VSALRKARAVFVLVLVFAAGCARHEPPHGVEDDGAAGAAGSPGDTFSFFVTSLGAMRSLASEFGAGEDGFGGDLRYGETTGLAGADNICTTIAERAMPGASAKTWRAFLSTQRGGPDGGPMHAIDRVGEGPWYDRVGRLVAATRADLLGERPVGADPLIVNDLPNEHGVPNHKDGAPSCTGRDCPDNHDTMTGTGPDGRLYGTDPALTCQDWTSAVGEAGPNGRPNGPWCGHSWPGDYSGRGWMSALQEGGCAAGVNLENGGGPQTGVFTVGTGGGYGGIYCFALTPRATSERHDRHAAEPPAAGLGHSQ